MTIKIFKRNKGDWALAVVGDDNSVVDWAAFTTADDVFAAAYMIRNFCTTTDGTTIEKPQLSFDALFAEMAADE